MLTDLSPNDYPSDEELGLEPMMDEQANDYRGWRQEQQAQRPPNEPAKARIGPDQMQLDHMATFVSAEGATLVGRVVEWGPKGAKIHVLDDYHGDRLHKVPYHAIQDVGAGAEVAKAEPATSGPALSPNLLEPGDAVSVTTPLGLLEGVVLASPTVEVALDDGRRMVVHFGQLAALQPGAGRDRLRALRARWAEVPGSGPDFLHAEEGAAP